MAQSRATSAKSRTCWLCGAPALEAQRVCWQCGADLSPESYAANAGYEGDGFLPTPQTPGSSTDGKALPPIWADERPSRDRHPSWPPALSALVNVGFATGFGVLGALIGGGIWYIVATTINFELGFFAILMGYLIGRGIVLGSTMRGGPPALLAAAITFAAYEFWWTVIRSHGVSFNLVDIPFLLVTFLVAVSQPLTHAPLDP